jgi:RNA polymerase-binding transcription factor DksA
MARLTRLTIEADAREHGMKNPTPLYWFDPDPCPECGAKIQFKMLVSDPYDIDTLREVWYCKLCAWRQNPNIKHPGTSYVYKTSEDEVDAIRSRVEDNEIQINRMSETICRYREALEKISAADFRGCIPCAELSKIATEAINA